MRVRVIIQHGPVTEQVAEQLTAEAHPKPITEGSPECTWTHFVHNPCKAEQRGEVCLKWPMWKAQQKHQDWAHFWGQDCGKGCCDS